MSIIANTLKEALNAKGEYRAGGTDQMERQRHRVSTAPVIDISRLPGMDSIESKGRGTAIGAFVTLDTLAKDENMRKNYPGFAMAADSLATPQVRNAASLGGSLLQRTRCWYYRHEGISCYKKGGDSCPARKGNHQFGVCFDLGPCVFPHPSTLGMCLLAYKAEVEIAEKGRRSIRDLYGDGKKGSIDHTLNEGEIITHIHLREPLEGEKAAYFRSISRARAEWPLVEVMVRYRIKGGLISDARVVMGGVANIPVELHKVDAYLNGKQPSEKTFQAAGKLATEGASPLPQTGYKVKLMEGTVFETLRRAEAGIWGGEG